MFDAIPFFLVVSVAMTLVYFIAYGIVIFRYFRGGGIKRLLTVYSIGVVGFTLRGWVEYFRPGPGMDPWVITSMSAFLQVGGYAALFLIAGKISGRSAKVALLTAPVIAVGVWFFCCGAGLDRLLGISGAFGFLASIILLVDFWLWEDIEFEEIYNHRYFWIILAFLIQFPAQVATLNWMHFEAFMKAHNLLWLDSVVAYVPDAMTAVYLAISTRRGLSE